MRIEDWLGADNQLGIDIWNKKYRHGDESFDDWLDRISGGDKKLRKLIEERKFLFGGRILANRGLAKDGKKLSYSNCYCATPPEDSIESIFEVAGKLARTFSYGGGVGIDISKLAPKGAKVNNTAEESSGAVSFTDLYSMITGLIGQHGRRGALMLSISCEHPDLEEFIAAKTDLERNTKANMSVRVTDEFMRCVVDGEGFIQRFERPETRDVIEKRVDAESIFRTLGDANYDYGEPGILYWDRISNWNLLSEYEKFQYAGVNPCVRGDTKILTKEYGWEEIGNLADKTIDVWNGFEWSTVTPHITGFNQPMLRVTTSDGCSVECTLYHKFHLGDGAIRTAEELKVGDELIAWVPIEGMMLTAYAGESVAIVSFECVEPAEVVYCMNEPKRHTFIANGMIVGNCAEEPLSAGGSCLLGSLNLAEFVEDSKFQSDEFARAVRIAVRALNDVLDEGLPLHPLQEQKDSVRDWRQIGLGIMGLADMLIKMGVRYGSAESLDVCHDIAQLMANTALKESALLAEQFGPFPKYDWKATAESPYFKDVAAPMTAKEVKKRGLRNSQLLTIAPTGTISTMLGVSGGIEPLFAKYFSRTTKSLDGKDTTYEVMPKILEDMVCDTIGMPIEDCLASLPDYVVAAHDIHYLDRLRMQSTWQHFIDASISSTINLPENFPKEEVRDIYMEAWRMGCKGVTIFREGCKREGILSTRVNGDREVSTNINDESLIGKKRKVITGCGNLHISAFFDPNTKQFKEIFLNKGSSGGCASYMNATSRLASLSLRNGCDIMDVIGQLDSVSACPSYAIRRATKGDTSKGSCCPSAVANALREMMAEMDGEISDKSDPSVNVKNPCPSCGSELTFSGGCNTCPLCGWSRCG